MHFYFVKRVRKKKKKKIAVRPNQEPNIYPSSPASLSQ